MNEVDEHHLSYLPTSKDNNLKNSEVMLICAKKIPENLVNNLVFLFFYFSFVAI